MDALLMPPLVCLIAAALGALAWRRRPRLARALVALGAGSLLLFSLPFVSGHLLASLQPAAPLELASLTPPAQAILVLAGDAQFDAPEYGSTTCGPLTLERLRYAAHLARATNLPVCVSGGPPKKDELSHAEMMRRALEEDFGVAVKWLEPWSGNTRENLRLSKVVLEKDGVQRVLLVTHAWHMPRALAEAQRHGLDALAAPTGFRATPKFLEASSWIVSAKALRESAWALHEWLGRLWYALA